MYTLDQSIAVKRYFNMINDKLLDLYKQSGKENKFHIDIDENESFDFFVNDEEKVGFSYRKIFGLDRCDTFIFSFDNIYFHAYKCIFLFFDDNDYVDSIVINNTSSLMKKKEVLENFNFCIDCWKDDIQRIFNIVAKALDVNPVVIGDFSIPSFVLDETNNIDDKKVKKVLAAALLYNGVYYLGNTHSGCANNIEINKQYTVKTDSEVKDNVTYNGYITSDGDFIFPDEAWNIARENDLIDEGVQCFQKNSEDFYSACGKQFDLMKAKQKIIEKHMINSGNKTLQKVKKGEQE